MTNNNNKIKLYYANVGIDMVTLDTVTWVYKWLHWTQLRGYRYGYTGHSYVGIDMVTLDTVTWV